MRMLSGLVTCIIGALGVEAQTITVLDASGAPVPNAVVTLEGAGAVPENYGTPNRVRQEGLAFHPHVLAVPRGQPVEFPNLDRVRHHVYSFSKGNRFQLELYGREEERTVTFDTAGTVAIGCNIHDNMLAYIRVLDVPHARVSDASGAAEFDAMPEGASSANVWYPGADKAPPMTVALKQEGDAYTLTLPPDAPAPTAAMQMN